MALNYACIKNKVDAIFSLSYYDTDATIDYKMIPIEITTPVSSNLFVSLKFLILDSKIYESSIAKNLLKFLTY